MTTLKPSDAARALHRTKTQPEFGSGGGQTDPKMPKGILSNNGSRCVSGTHTPTNNRVSFAKEGSKQPDIPLAQASTSAPADVDFNFLAQLQQKLKTDVKEEKENVDAEKAALLSRKEQLQQLINSIDKQLAAEASISASSTPALRKPVDDFADDDQGEDVQCPANQLSDQENYAIDIIPAAEPAKTAKGFNRPPPPSRQQSTIASGVVSPAPPAQELGAALLKAAADGDNPGSRFSICSSVAGGLPREGEKQPTMLMTEEVLRCLDDGEPEVCAQNFAAKLEEGLKADNVGGLAPDEDEDLPLARRAPAPKPTMAPQAKDVAPAAEPEPSASSDQQPQAIAGAIDLDFAAKLTLGLEDTMDADDADEQPVCGRKNKVVAPKPTVMLDASMLADIDDDDDIPTGNDLGAALNDRLTNLAVNDDDDPELVKGGGIIGSDIAERRRSADSEDQGPTTRAPAPTTVLTAADLADIDDDEEEGRGGAVAASELSEALRSQVSQDPPKAPAPTTLLNADMLASLDDEDDIPMVADKLTVLADAQATDDNDDVGLKAVPDADASLAAAAQAALQHAVFEEAANLLKAPAPTTMLSASMLADLDDDEEQHDTAPVNAAALCSKLAMEQSDDAAPPCGPSAPHSTTVVDQSLLAQLDEDDDIPTMNGGIDERALRGALASQCEEAEPPRAPAPTTLLDPSMLACLDDDDDEIPTVDAGNAFKVDQLDEDLAERAEKAARAPPSAPEPTKLLADSTLAALEVDDDDDVVVDGKMAGIPAGAPKAPDAAGINPDVLRDALLGDASALQKEPPRAPASTTVLDVDLLASLEAEANEEPEGVDPMDLRYAISCEADRLESRTPRAPMPTTVASDDLLESNTCNIDPIFPNGGVNKPDKVAKEILPAGGDAAKASEAGARRTALPLSDYELRIQNARLHAEVSALRAEVSRRRRELGALGLGACRTAAA